MLYFTDDFWFVASLILRSCSGGTSRKRKKIKIIKLAKEIKMTNNM